MSTFVAKNIDLNKKTWYVVDAQGKVLGRLASEIARVLRGKHTPQFTPNADTGDFVVVVNAEKILVTGRKETRKLYHDHTGFVGGIKTKSVRDLREKKPQEILWRAVKGMIPQGVLGRNQLSKLKIYQGEHHPHAAQQPVDFPFYKA